MSTAIISLARVCYLTVKVYFKLNIIIEIRLTAN